MNPNLSDPSPKTLLELIQFLSAQPEDQRHVAVWVLPFMAEQLIQSVGFPVAILHPEGGMMQPAAPAVPAPLPIDPMAPPPPLPVAVEPPTGPMAPPPPVEPPPIVP